MSTYAASEAALLAAVRASSGGAVFTATNSSRGNFAVLNNEGVTVAAILMQATRSEFGDNLGQGRGTQGKRQQRHRIGIVVFQARGQADDGTSYQALVSVTDALIAYLDTYQRLGNATNVKRAQVVEASEPRIRRDSAWIFQTLLVEVLTETAPALVETAH
jgi:hypothetical protein